MKIKLKAKPKKRLKIRLKGKVNPLKLKRLKGSKTRANKMF